MCAQLHGNVLGHLDGDGHAGRGDRYRALDCLCLVQVSVGLARREVELFGQRGRGLRDGATLGEQIECSVQA